VQSTVHRYASRELYLDTPYCVLSPTIHSLARLEAFGLIGTCGPKARNNETLAARTLSRGQRSRSELREGEARKRNHADMIKCIGSSARSMRSSRVEVKVDGCMALRFEIVVCL